MSQTRRATKRKLQLPTDPIQRPSLPLPYEPTQLTATPHQHLPTVTPTAHRRRQHTTSAPTSLIDRRVRRPDGYVGGALSTPLTATELVLLHHVSSRVPKCAPRRCVSHHNTHTHTHTRREVEQSTNNPVCLCSPPFVAQDGHYIQDDD
jgi:hypothetical protein